MPQNSPSDLRFALRDGTRSAHERVDAKASRFDLGTLTGYRDFLIWHAACVPPIEAHLEIHGIDEAFPDWPERRRAGAVRNDLTALGARPVAPIAVDLPTDAAGIVGIAYVLEGSRLGGAMLVRGVDPDWRGVATAYLDHGAGLKLWPRFVDRLNAIDLSGAGIEAAIGAANRTFEVFERALEPFAESRGVLAAQ